MTGCQQVVFDRAPRVARPVEMIANLGAEMFHAVGFGCLDRLRRLAVQPPPPRLAEPSVNHLADLVMTEGIAFAALFAQNAFPPQFIQPHDQFAFLQTTGDCQGLVYKGVPQDGGQPGQFAPLRRHQPQSLVDHLLDAEGHPQPPPPGVLSLRTVSPCSSLILARSNSRMKSDSLRFLCTAPLPGPSGSAGR